MQDKVERAKKQESGAKVDFDLMKYSACKDSMILDY